jgi:hypothetical protein
VDSAGRAHLRPPTRNSASVLRIEGAPVGWVLSVTPAACEAGGSFRYAERKPWARVEGPTADPERAAREAARRANGNLRRYCTANRLNRFGTLTYAGEGNHDPELFRRHIAAFFRQLRDELGGRAFPYAWVPEWHNTDHGLHAHFVVGRYIDRKHILRAWGRGLVHIKLIGDLPVGSGAIAEARKAAGYLAKYVSKSFEDERRVPGLHRYDVAQGFQPAKVQVQGRTLQEALGKACSIMGGRQPAVVWSSADVEGWEGPPAVWASWGD